MIVDELTTKDMRASAQSLYGLIVFGLGVVGGNLLSGYISSISHTADGLSYTRMFGIPMWISLACLILLALAYPANGRSRRDSAEAASPSAPPRRNNFIDC